MTQTWAEHKASATLSEKVENALGNAQRCLERAEDSLGIRPVGGIVTQRSVAWATLGQGYADVAKTYAYLMGGTSPAVHKWLDKS